MRLRQVSKQISLVDGLPVVSLLIEFTSGGIDAALQLALPDGWSNWTRQQKIDWGKQQVAVHLATNTYVSANEIIYPDAVAPENARNDFENMPGWATWTATETEAWIEINVTNLATAKTALKAMAKAIIYLRDVVIEK